MSRVPWILPLVLGLAISAPAAGAVDVDTFGFGTKRVGDNVHEHALGPGAARTLRQVWSAKVAAPVTTQPLIAHGVRIANRFRADLVIVGTEHGMLVALDEQSGRVIWRRDLGKAVPGPDFGCPSFPDKTYGVTGTPVIDRSAGRVYAVGGDDRAYAVRLRDGAVVPGWPLRVGNPAHEHVWGAMTLSRGRMYAGIGAYCDNPPYAGAVVAIDVARARLAARFVVTREQGAAPYGGGVWGWGGVAADPLDGDIYAASGNSLTPSEDAGYAEQVIRLSAGLHVREANEPFTSRTTIDQDFGATPALFDPPGCPPMLVALNKGGDMLVYDRHHLARGPRQRLLLAPGTSEGAAALLGLPAYVARTRMLYVASPLDPSPTVHRAGLLAYHVDGRCRLVLRWRNRAGVYGLTGAPMAADGVIYLTTGSVSTLVAIDAATGRTLTTIPLGTRGVFAAPTPADGALLTAGYDGRVRRFLPAR